MSANRARFAKAVAQRRADGLQECALPQTLRNLRCAIRDLYRVAYWMTTSSSAFAPKGLKEPSASDTSMVCFPGMRPSKISRLLIGTM